MVTPDSWLFVVVHLLIVTIPFGAMAGVLVGLAVARLWSTPRLFLLLDAALGAVGFFVGEVISVLGPTTMRSHRLGDGVTMTDYNEPLLAPLRYPMAVIVATLFVVSVRYAIDRWQRRRIPVTDPEVPR